MTAPRPRFQWVPVAIGMIVALTVGVFGGDLIRPFFGGQEPVLPEFDAPDADRQVDQIVPPEPPAPAPAPSATPTPQPEQIDTAAADRQAQLDELEAELAADRTRQTERARLAAESPLTPAVEDLASMVERMRAAGKPAGTGTGMATVAPDAAATEQGKTPDERPAIAGIPGTAPPSGVLSHHQSHLLYRGSIIPAVLLSPIDSDLPGLVRAQVAETVFDSLTGRHVLIPRGSTLVGTYGTDTTAGQRRLFVAWTDLRLPDGTPVDIDRFGTIGADGASGAPGQRRTGLLAALGAAVLFDLAGNATQILTGVDGTPDSDLGQVIAAATGSATSRVADQYVGDLLARGARFRVPAGTQMNVIVEQDVAFPDPAGIAP